jgi:hypothetical protein
MPAPLPATAAESRSKRGDLRPLHRVPLLMLGFAGLFVGTGAA